MSTLHILNGDSTLYVFQQTDIDGDTMVWREVLSEGPLRADIASADFWEIRSEWICKTFDDQPDSYHDGMIGQLGKLSNPYDELNIWFEYDLHCQANMLGVMNYLQQQTDLSGPAIYLVNPASFPDKPDFGGMGELSGEELDYLYDNIRVQLSEIDFIIAAEAWNIFVQYDAALLKRYLTETTFWGSLHCLKNALKAHLKRLQTNAAGLNYVEQKILDIYNSGITASRAVCAEFWKTDKIYGMGDLEVGLYLNKLKLL